jgi:hypothetical protein
MVHPDFVVEVVSGVPREWWEILVPKAVMV